MKKLNKVVALTSVCLLALGATQLCAQDEGQGRGRRGGGGGGFGGGDPAQFQQQRMERLKEQLEVKDDTEWKAIEPLITKVMDAQRDLNTTRIAGGGRGGRGGGGGGFGGGGGGGGFGGAEPAPEVAALTTAIESKASNADIKAALTKYRDVRKAKEAALTKAQDDLRKVVSVRQEAILVTSNILN
jgi:hypothetical protein